MNKIYGIDISKYQGSIQWPQVKTAGKEFAFIRLGWCGYDGGIVVNKGLDPNFKSNVDAAVSAGLHVGVYLYSYAKTPAAAKIAAKEALELIKPYRITYPVVLDLEDPMYTAMDKGENTVLASAFLEEIEQAGYYPMLYTYKFFAEGNLNMDALKAYDLWIAQYAKENTYKGPYGIWQYEVGYCPGVSTLCDLNVASKDYAQLIADAGKNHLGGANSTEPPGSEEQVEHVLLAFDKAIAAVRKMIEELL